MLQHKLTIILGSYKKIRANAHETRESL